MNHLTPTIDDMTMSLAGILFFGSLLLTLVLMPFWIRFLKRKRLLDRPDARKTHASPTPSMGGVVVFIALMPGLLFMEFSMTWLLLFISLLVIQQVGMWDDLKDLPAKRKFVAQFAVATLLFFAGFKVESLYGFMGIEELNSFWQFLITVVFIVGIMNAFNLIDGVDGLLGGIIVMNGLCYFILFALGGASNYLLLCTVLIGGTLGFLYYNTNPAKIFMGDSGSLFLGTLMAVFALQSLQTPMIEDGHISPLIAFAPLLLPVIDTARLFASRMLAGKSPFKADRNHYHHLVSKAGFSDRHTVRMLYLHNFFNLIFCLALLSLSFTTGLFILLLFSIVLFKTLDLIEAKQLAHRKRKIRKRTHQLVQENQLLKRLKS